MKNQPKIDQKSTKNRSWRPLGASWGLLGGSWRSRGHLWGPLGGVLGASWGVLVASWAPLGGQHGPKLTPKTEPKSMKNRSKNRPIFQYLLGSIFAWFWCILGSKWTQLGLKNRTQIDVIFKRRFFEKTSFFLGKNYNFEGSGGRS